MSPKDERILVYVHGDGPGSTWAERVRAGEECEMLGPRNSLDARHSSGALAVFGDETALGLAHALKCAAGNPITAFKSSLSPDAAEPARGAGDEPCLLHFDSSVIVGLCSNL